MAPAEWEALRLSFQVALSATAIALPFGVAAAWILARRSFRGRGALEVLLNMPLVMPPVVTGWLLLMLFGHQGVIGGWLEETLGLSVAFTWRGAALAAAVVSFPLLVRAVRLSFEAVDPGLEQAARTLGARPLRVFLTVTLPLGRPGIAAGSLLAFARSLGEFGATVMLAGNIPCETRTVPLALYSLAQTPGAESRMTGLLIVSVTLSAAALACGEWLARRPNHR